MTSLIAIFGFLLFIAGAIIVMVWLIRLRVRSTRSLETMASVESRRGGMGGTLKPGRVKTMPLGPTRQMVLYESELEEAVSLAEQFGAEAGERYLGAVVARRMWKRSRNG